MKYNYYKNEKGSITLFVLLAMLFFTAVLLTAYIKSSNTAITQEEDILRIKESYEQGLNNIDEVYATIGSQVDRAIRSGKALSETKNIALTDLYGNIITVPAGFKITKDASTVDKGIVIEDENENQFVWIPVPTDGKIYTNEEKTEYQIVKLNRYSFDANGIPAEQDDKIINESYQESSDSSYGNAVAKSLEEFKESVKENHGYYIGRYEARTGTERSKKEDALTTVTEKGTDYIYNLILQPQASEQCKNMYTSSNFTSDLMNSYAWDLNTTLAKQGTNNTETPDKICNVYDMASNTREWTTETCLNSDAHCTNRAGDKTYSQYTAGDRRKNSNVVGYADVGFRPILYL